MGDLREEGDGKKKLQADNTVLGVAGDMEPGAGVDEGGIPALQHVGGIRQPRPPCVQRFPCSQPKSEKNSPFFFEEQRGRKESSPSGLVDKAGEAARSRRRQGSSTGREAIRG